MSHGKKNHQQRKLEWRLDALPVPKLAWADFSPSNLLRHPLVPIVLAVLFSGAANNMLSILIGLGIVTLWVAADLWPFANLASIWIVNRMAFTHERPYPKLPVIERRRADLEYNRREVRASLRAIIFSSLCFLIIALDLPVVKLAFDLNFKKERVDVYNNLTAQPSVGDAGAASALLTVKNNSSHNIHVIEMRCAMNSARYRNPLVTFQNVQFLTFKGDQLLVTGGDGVSSQCPAGIEGAPTCADITWAVFYSLEESKGQIFSKGFRYALPEGKTQWEQLPLHYDKTVCGEGEK
jgi:hypothetical protein